MMVTLFSTIIALLFLIIIFFLIRTVIIAITMLTEVPYLPSNKSYKKAVEYLDIKEGDKVIDIGCGDGRVLRYAAKKYPKTEFVGIDRNFSLIAYAKFLNVFFRKSNLHFKHVNLHDFDLSDFDKIYLYLLPKVVDEVLLEKRNQLKEGCTVVSFHYGFSKNFFDINNTTQYPVEYRNRKENIYKWIKK